MLKVKHFIIPFLFIKTLYSQSSIKDSLPVINKRALTSVLIKSKNPISEKYSVIKLSKLDIYMNPSSNADALKAITILPSSTNTDETANPAIRGGDVDRTRIVLNGVPIINPVRNSQLNGLGNFSLFNTELISKQYVYASNSPLTFTSASSGVVDIETTKSVNRNETHFTLSLANLGFLRTQIIDTNLFFQTYGNFQFSPLFINLNGKNIENVSAFSAKDIGLNLRYNISKILNFNTYNYLINENYNSHQSLFNFYGNSEASNSRLFSINNLELDIYKSKLKISSLVDISKKKYFFGNIDTRENMSTYFSSIGIKNYFSKEFVLQYGFDFSVFNKSIIGNIPLYYFSVSDSSFIKKVDTTYIYQYLESYVYAAYQRKKIGVSAGLRKNIPMLSSQDNFLSIQLSCNLELDRSQRLIFSIGKYFSYSIGSISNNSIKILGSHQAALDYYLKYKKIEISSALYYKLDTGDKVDYINNGNKKTYGFEFSILYSLNKYISTSLSNSSFYQDIRINNLDYIRSEMYYFFKIQILYNNPKIFNASLLYITRPGEFYTPIQSANYINSAKDFSPVYGSYFASQYNSYHRVDLSINKSFQVTKNYGIICFLSVNNLLNLSNNSSILYSKDYSSSSAIYYPHRIIYFGLQMRI